VYTETSIDRPDPKTFTLRTSGGHIHMGIGAMVEDYGAVCFLTALLDRVLGTSATVLCGSSAEYQRRMELYGRAGTIRLKRNISVLEYRVLPAMALIPNPDHALLMFTAAQACAALAVDMWESNKQAMFADFGKLLGDIGQMSQVAGMINTSNAEACLESLRSFQRVAPSELSPILGALLCAESVAAFDLTW
jgi:hypothetical protein